MARLRLIVLAPLLITGCELVFGIKESSSSSSGTGGAGGAVTGPEAGADAPPDQDANDASAQPFCASQPPHFLCADFDEGGVGLDWTDTNHPGPGLTSALDAVAYVSPPASFGVTADPAGFSTPPSCSSSRLVKQFSGSAKGIHLELDFSGCDGALTKTGSVMEFLDVNCTLDGLDGGSDTTFGVVNWGLHPGGYQLTVYGADATMSAGTLGPTIDTGTPPPGVFKHVSLDVAFGPSSSLTFSVEGLPTITRTGLNTSCSTTHDKALTLGIFGCNQLAACEVRFDNVVVDLD